MLAVQHSLTFRLVQSWHLTSASSWNGVVVKILLIQAWEDWSPLNWPNVSVRKHFMLLRCGLRPNDRKSVTRDDLSSQSMSSLYVFNCKKKRKKLKS